MSAIGMPISEHAAALRIIGATTSRPRSNAWTGPTVVASSPVPSHAFEITPVRTQRLSWISCRRARSRPRYSSSLVSGVSAATISARSGFASMVDRKPRTNVGSGFQLTYSGGSKAGNRFTSREFLLELAQKTGGGRRRHADERVAELDRRRVAVVGIGLQRLVERLLDDFGNVGSELTDGLGLAAQPRDHHFLRVATLKRQLAREHLERDDAERVDIAARIERLAANLLRAHELGRSEDDAGGRELRDRGIGAALLGKAEVHHHRALRASPIGDEHDVFRLQVPMDDLELVRVMQAGAHLLQQFYGRADIHRPAAHLAVGEQLAFEEWHDEIDQPVL